MIDNIEFEAEREILTVSELNQTVKYLLEKTFSSVWVEGEISNLALPSSGHAYFSLKDSGAQVRCAFFRQRQANLLGMKLENGMQVLVKAQVSLYENRGDFQLIVTQVEDVGFGRLQKAFELLKQKLASEGLFDLAFKKDMPAFVKKLGIITSPTGAAVRDVLTVLKRRFPLLEIIIYPTQVQGNLAAKQISDAIVLANERQECDLLLLTRGGGSLEDLWPFNEESVARAIFNSKLPIVSAVGHEVDVTISDFVADIRAATPSAAAELISQEQSAILNLLNNYQRRFIQVLNQQLLFNQQQLQMLQKRLRHPKELLQQQMQRLDYLENTLKKLILQNIKHHQHAIEILNFKLQANAPKNTLQNYQQKLSTLNLKLNDLIKLNLQDNKNHLQLLARALNQINPLATLERGYTLTLDESGKVISSVTEAKENQRIKTKFHDGIVESLVM